MQESSMARGRGGLSGRWGVEGMAYDNAAWQARLRISKGGAVRARGKINFQIGKLNGVQSRRRTVSRLRVQITDAWRLHFKCERQVLRWAQRAQAGLLPKIDDSWCPAGAPHRLMIGVAA